MFGLACVCVCVFTGTNKGISGLPVDTTLVYLDKLCRLAVFKMLTSAIIMDYKVPCPLSGQTRHEDWTILTELTLTWGRKLCHIVLRQWEAKVALLRHSGVESRHIKAKSGVSLVC